MLRVLFPILLAITFFSAVYVLLPASFSVSRAQALPESERAETLASESGPGQRMSISKSSLARFNSAFPGAGLNISRATGAATFIHVKNGTSQDFSAGATVSKRAGAVQKSLDPATPSKVFFREHADLFGLADPDADLQLARAETETSGAAHQSFEQFYRGIPVFAGLVKTHFDANGRLYAAAGTVVPEIDLDVTPSRTAEEAAATALEKVSAERGVSGLRAASVKLYVFRTNLARGIPGEDRLVWEVTVEGSRAVREFVYLDAHTGKFVDQYTGTPDALTRRAYNGQGSTNPTPPNYPSTPFWVEGQAFPTGNAEADNMIASSGETYNFYRNAFGRDSYNGTGGVMDSIFNRGNNCPNASWSGKFISFCPGLTSDDVTAHEWTHAYTEYTGNQIYAWQPGALNEGYSDVFGETVDRLNNRDNTGNSLTDPARTADNCSTLTPVTRLLRANSPAAVAGTYNVGWANFGPDLTIIPPVTANLVQALDAPDAAGPMTTDACSPLTNAAAIAGRIALVDRGTCEFKLKVLNAQNAGAVGVVVANTAANADGLFIMPDDPSITTPITIPSVVVLLGTANKLRSQPDGTVNVSLTKTNNTDASTRWLIGEDNTGQLGILRDMYNPACYLNPGKVTDTQFYTCTTQDNGGVHGNSGVVNHAYALLVDGGTYNGQTINGIGLTKAAHIYFRAQAIYQNRISDFAFHADSLEQAANDLLNVNLNSLTTGAPSGQSISAADIAELQKTIAAVELRTPPAFCNFQPLLAKNPPAEPSCNAGTFRNTAFADNFEGANPGWTTGAENVSPGNTLPNWVLSNMLPDNVAGQAYFVANPDSDCTTGAQDQTALRFLQSPLIPIVPSYAGKLTLSFDHWVASEANYDGGQLLYSVNGAPFALVPAANFIYNGPNLTLATAGNTNPRAGQKAWSGTDGGSVKGTFGKTMVDLTGLANAGDNVRFRWDFGNDSCAGSSLGWYVDNISLNACFGPTAATTALTGRVVAGDGKAIAGAVVTVTGPDGAGRTVKTNMFGKFTFENLETGATYLLKASAKRYTFAPQVVAVTGEISELTLTAQ